MPRINARSPQLTVLDWPLPAITPTLIWPLPSSPPSTTTVISIIPTTLTSLITTRTILTISTSPIHNSNNNENNIFLGNSSSTSPQKCASTTSQESSSHRAMVSSYLTLSMTLAITLSLTAKIAWKYYKKHKSKTSVKIKHDVEALQNSGSHDKPELKPHDSASHLNHNEASSTFNTATIHSLATAVLNHIRMKALVNSVSSIESKMTAMGEQHEDDRAKHFEILADIVEKLQHVQQNLDDSVREDDKDWRRLQGHIDNLYEVRQEDRDNLAERWDDLDKKLVEIQNSLNSLQSTDAVDEVAAAAKGGTPSLATRLTSESIAAIVDKIRPIIVEVLKMSDESTEKSLKSIHANASRAIGGQEELRDVLQEVFQSQHDNQEAIERELEHLPGRVTGLLEPLWTAHQPPGVGEEEDEEGPQSQRQHVGDGRSLEATQRQSLCDVADVDNGDKDELAASGSVGPREETGSALKRSTTAIWLGQEQR